MRTLLEVITRLMPEMHELLWEEMKKQQSKPKYEWWTKLLKIKPAELWEQEYSSQTRTQAWEAGTETSDYPEVDWDPPTDTTIQMIPYRAKMTVTDIWLKYGQGRDLHRNAKFMEFLDDFVKGALDAMDARFAAIFLDAHTGGIFVTPDGEPLISATHSLQGNSVTWDNAITDALDAGALTAYEALNSVSDLVDSKGRPLHTNFDTLVVSRKNRRPAYELINNTVLPGASNDEKNYWHGVIENIVELPWLKENIQTGASDYHFMLDSELHQLEALILEAPNLRPIVGGNPDIVEIGGRTIFEARVGNWLGVAGSDGSS